MPIHRIAAGFIALLFCLQVLAATPEESGFLLNEQLLREQQQQLKARERQRLLQELERSLQPVTPSVPAPAEKRPLPASKACFTIQHIELDGVENLLDRELDAMRRPWLGRCMRLADIELLRREIERYYIEQGWILARVYLKPGQNISGGELAYVVREGKLDSVRLNFGGTEERLQAATAFAGMQGESIHLRDIEQGLDQINRLQSARALMKIEPVRDRAGWSRLLVNSVENNPLRLTLTYDNHGSQSTGEQRAVLTLDSDNLLSLNDNLYLSLSGSAGSAAQRSNRGVSLSLSLPYGYWLYTLSANRSQYKTTSKGDTVSFVTTGTSDNASIKASRVIHRDRHSKTTVDMVLNLKTTETYVQDVKLQTGSRKLVVADIQLQHVARFPGGRRSAQITYSRGLSTFGALLDEPLSGDDVPRAQFEKIGWHFGYSQALGQTFGHWQYQATVSGQISRHPLFGSEQIAIGNSATVRGFRDSPVSGDAGLAIKNDFQWLPDWQSDSLQGLRFTFGLDAGYVRARNNNLNNSGQAGATLAGVSVSAQQSIGLAQDQRLDWTLTLGKGLYAPAFIDNSRTVVMFNLGWKFW